MLTNAFHSETTSTAAAIRRPEPLSHTAMMQRYASYGGGYGSEEYGGDRGFDEYTQGSSSSRPAGGYQKYRGYQSYSTYTAPGRSAGASTGGQVYDVKRSKPSFNPPGFSSAARLRAAPGSTGRELLEEAGFGSNGGIVVESDAPIKPRPKADLASFEVSGSSFRDAGCTHTLRSLRTPPRSPASWTCCRPQLGLPRGRAQLRTRRRFAIPPARAAAGSAPAVHAPLACPAPSVQGPEKQHDHGKRHQHSPAFRHVYTTQYSIDNGRARVAGAPFWYACGGAFADGHSVVMYRR